MKNLLVIEDDIIFQKTILEALKDAGFNVIIAENGQDGLKKTKEHKPDLVIADIVMPKMNGIEFLKALKQDKEIAEIPVVMLTAYENMAMVNDAIRLGCRGYLEKTRLTLDDLADKIRNFLE
ncbi:MAG: response regulator receiver protein [Parcubacteria group bacterium Gr01-1014_3]|nr:MAG: response regulator receiver protein [Parcubacteria group bacterium Gr01-1014_3]